MSEDDLIPPETLGLPVAPPASAGRSAPGRGPHAVEGVDRSQVVSISMGPDGLVTTVQIDARWRSHLPPEGLQDAVFEAYHDAYRQAAAQITAPAPPPTTATPTSRPSPPDGRAVDGDHAWLNDTRDRLDQTADALERTAESWRAGTHAERVVEGPRRWAALIMNGPTVLGVRLDIRAATQEPPDRLAADILAAFHAQR